MKNMALSTQTVDVKKLSDIYPNIDFSELKSMENAKPTLLIGQDNWSLLVNHKIVYDKWNGPALTKTKLGWAIHGNISGNIQERNFICYTREKDLDEIDETQEITKKPWLTETFEEKHSVNSSLPNEDKRANDIAERTMKKINDRYETDQLWKNENVILHESKENATTRLYSIEN